MSAIAEFAETLANDMASEWLAGDPRPLAEHAGEWLDYDRAIPLFRYPEAADFSDAELSAVEETVFEIVKGWARNE